MCCPENKGIEKLHLLYKKVATRFLKDIGLYSTFLEYVNDPKKHGTFYKLSKNNWYKKEHVDMIFGQTMFTAYIEKKINGKLDHTITDVFRTYLNKKYPGKFTFRRNQFIKGEDEYTNIDADIDIISIGITLKNKAI